MIFGGIPFYLGQLQVGMNLAQNMDALCFEKDAFMRDEFFILSPRCSGTLDDLF